MPLLRLPKSLDLATHPTRTAFIEHFSKQLHAHGQTNAAIQSKLNAIRWLFAATEKPPHETDREDFLKFMTKAASMGSRPARLSALRFSILLAFDQMCGALIVTPPPRIAEPRPRSPALLTRERTIACLADELGLEARDLRALHPKNVSLEDQLITLPSPYGSGQRRIALTRKANSLLIEAQGWLFDPEAGR